MYPDCIVKPWITEDHNTLTPKQEKAIDFIKTLLESGLSEVGEDIVKDHVEIKQTGQFKRDIRDSSDFLLKLKSLGISIIPSGRSYKFIKVSDTKPI